MKAPVNVWLSLNVQGIELGNFFHRHEEKEKEDWISLNSSTSLVKKVVDITDYVVIGLKSENVGYHVPQLVLDTYVFERLYNHPFTSITDYFLLAKNCISLFGENGNYINYEKDDSRECYFFHTKLPNAEDLKFYFVIDFSLQ